MINVEKVEIEGFGSILGPFKYKFNRPGLNIIKGRVGCGKTSILDALLWAFYGGRTKAKASVEPWEHIRTKEYRGTCVEATVYRGEDKIQIIRCHNFKGEVHGRKGKNLFAIRLNGVFLDRLRDKKHVQAEVNQLLGYSEDLFRSSVLFGQKVARFMDETGPKRKQIMEEAFEVAYIGKAQKLAQDRLQAVVVDLLQRRQKVDLLTENLESAQESITLWEDLQKKAVKENAAQVKVAEQKLREALTTKLDIRALSKSVDDLKGAMSSLEGRIKNVPEHSELKALEKTEMEVDFAVLQAQGNVTELERKIGDLKLEFGAVARVCDSCGQPLSPKVRAEQKEIIKTKLSKAREKLKITKSELSILKGKLETCQGKTSSLRSIINEVTPLSAKLVKLGKELFQAQSLLKDARADKLKVQELKDKLKELQAFKPNPMPTQFKEKVKKIGNRLKVAQERLIELRKKEGLLNWAIKGPLSNAGMKSYIFDTMIESFNQALHKYTPILGFRTVMGVKMESAHKDFEVFLYQQDALIPSADISGGQKQLVNLAIALAGNTVYTQNKPINLLALDECFEGLGDEEIEKVADMIRKMTKGKNVHLITHRAFEPINSYITHLHLVNGRTELYTKLQNS